MVIFVDEFDGVVICFAYGEDGLPDGRGCFAVVDDIFDSDGGLPGDGGVVSLVAFDLDLGG